MEGDLKVANETIDELNRQKHEMETALKKYVVIVKDVALIIMLFNIQEGNRDSLSYHSPRR